MIQESKAMTYVHSDIRGDLFLEALRMEKEGERVLKLNTGNPGAFGFSMPESVKQALLSDIDKTVPYCDFRGMLPAREAICRYHTENGIRTLTPDDVFITNGVSEGAAMLITSIIDHGDEVLLPTPCYPLWSNQVHIAGGTPIYYRCDEENYWNPDASDIERKITSRTKAIVIINPNNPTGAVYSRDVLLQILGMARAHGLLVISDEIYDRLLYDRAEYVSTASLAGEDTLVVTLNGLSKSHCLCGFRCGWIVLSGPESDKSELRGILTKLATLRLCANSFMQLVVPAALEDTRYTNAMTSVGGKLDERRRAVLTAIERAKHISAVPNHGAFYIFAKANTRRKIESDKRFCMDLLHEKKILVMPGSCFEFEDPDHFRIVMLPEPSVLQKAIEDIDDFIDTYY